MKRVLSIGAVLAVAILFLVLLRLTESNAPQFKRLQTPPFVQPSNHVSFDFLSPRPFEGGELWIHATSSRTNFESFLYDLNRRKVVGQLTRGWPVMQIDRSRLLCVQALSDWKPLKERLFGVIERISRGRIKFTRPPRGYAYEPHRYWLLDLEKNSAARMGDLPGLPNFTFQPSPDLRYGYSPLHGAGVELDVYRFDFKRGSIKKLDVHGWPSGWWDQTNILILTTNNDFVLHDVTTEKSSLLIGAGRIAAFLRDNMISEDPAKTRAFFLWNGRENDFYLTDTHQKWLAEESFLIKVERPDGRLTLLASRFKFEWSDSLDPTGRYYLFSGREAGAASDGVFLRDKQSGSNRTLVIPTKNTYFSIPRFYGDSVIYVRSNILRRISLDGTSNVQLFPP